MMASVRRAKQMPPAVAGLLFGVGLIGVVCSNWRSWRNERALISEREPEAESPHAGWPRQPKVSVLVAAWNEASNIEGHLRSFEALGYPNLELLLCAGGSDGTYELARRLAGPAVTVLEQRPGEGKQRSLQRCFQRASGSIVVFTDADCLFSDGAFSRLVRPLVEGRAQVVTGVSEPKPAQRGLPIVRYLWFGDVAWVRRSPELVDGVLGRNCAMLREVLESVAALEARVATGTDYFLSRRLVQAGYPIRLEPGSSIATDYPDTARSYVRMWRRWNKNLLVHGVRFGAWNDVRGVLTGSAVAGAIMVLPALALLVGPLALVCAALLFCMAAAGRVRRLALGAAILRSPLSWDLLRGLPFYASLDLLAVLLAAFDAVRPRMRSRW